MLTAAIIAKAFNVEITSTRAVGEVNESENADMALAVTAGTAILEDKGDEAVEVHEMVDGFIISGTRNAVLMGNEGAYKVLSPKDKTTTEDADETLIGAWKGKATDNDTFNKAVKGLNASLGSEGDLNFVKYAGKDGAIMGAVVKGKDGADKYLIPVPKMAEAAPVDPAVLPAASAGVKQAIAFIKAGKHTEAAVALGRVSERLSSKLPAKLKESKGIAAHLTEAAECVEENPAEALAHLHEAYMAIASDSSSYDPDAAFSIYSNTVSFRCDTFIAKTPDYSVANFVMGQAIKEVMSGPLGDKVAKAIREVLSKSPKVKALDIELRKVNESEEGTANLNEDDANTYDAAALKARIKEMHDRLNLTLAVKLGEDDDATVFLGGNRNSFAKEYTDARFQLGQKLERDDNGGIGKWVTDPGHSQGAGTGTGDASNIKEEDELLNTTAKAATEAAKAGKKGIMPGEGKGTVSPYAGKDDDGKDEKNDGDGTDPDETVAVVIKSAKGLELRTGYEGQGTILASEDVDADDDDKAKEALGRLASKAQSLGYVYVPANMKEDEDENVSYYAALNRVLVPMLESPAAIEKCKTWIEAYEKGVAEGDLGTATATALQIAKTLGKEKEIPEGLIEGLHARAHKVGRRPLIKSRFKLKGFGKPKGKTGPGSGGAHTSAPAGKRGINIGEDAGNAMPGANSGKVSTDGKESDTFQAPSAPLKDTGPGIKGQFSKAPKGPTGIKVKDSTDEGVDEGDEQCKAGDFVSFGGKPHVITGIEKGGKNGAIAPVKLEKTGEWEKTGPAMTVATSEMNFLKKGKVSESATKTTKCPECDCAKVTETVAGMKCEGCGYVAGKAKFIVEVDSNQEGDPKLNTASIKKAKTAGPQNLIPKGNTPPKTEGTSNDAQNLMCACPNCENTQDITITGKKVKCGNCDYVGTAADFQLPSTVGDTVESWVEKARSMTVEEFTDMVGALAGTASNEAFKERMDALVEAYKTKPGRKNLARKITAANPLVKRKLGKGINLEGVMESTTSAKQIRMTFPKARVDEFIIAAREAGVSADGEVEMVENNVQATFLVAEGEKIRALFRGEDVTVEYVA